MTLEEANALLESRANQRRCPHAWIITLPTYSTDHDGHLTKTPGYKIQGTSLPNAPTIELAFERAMKWLEGLKFEPATKPRPGFVSHGKWYRPDGSFLCSD